MVSTNGWRKKIASKNQNHLSKKRMRFDPTMKTLKSSYFKFNRIVLHMLVNYIENIPALTYISTTNKSMYYIEMKTLLL